MPSPQVSPQALADEAAARFGADRARLATVDDGIESAQPRLVIEPDTEEGLAAVLAWASSQGLAVIVRGGGTKLGWGPPPTRCDLILSTVQLNRVIAHRYGDLTATVEAGARLAEVNRELGAHGQWLALDPPWAARATIGGIVATNDSGPRRHRYGAPRDLIIGVALARTDGRLAKAGGIVVKNVAGYDLGKLLAGSFGSLAVIVSATFKLAPVPPASGTLVADLASADVLGALLADLGASTLTPTAVELDYPPVRLLVRFETVAAAIDGQLDVASRLAATRGARVSVVGGDEEHALWTAHADRPWHQPGAVIKLTLRPGDLGGALAWLTSVAARPVDHEVVGRAGLGVLLVRLGGDVPAQAQLITELRARFPAGRGSAVLLRGNPELKRLIDVWGPIGDGLPIMRAVKQQFDPTGTLNPGRGPGGI